MTKLFENREISWLKFNERVLYQALDKKTPLLERLKFLSIYGNNLDEFMMVRVGSLLDQRMMEESMIEEDEDDVISNIMEWLTDVEPVVKSVYEKLVKEFNKQKIQFIDLTNLDKTDKQSLETLWQKQVKPYLVPQLLRGHHPFPFLENKRSYLMVMLLTKQKKVRYGILSLQSIEDHYYYWKKDRLCIVSGIDIVEYFIEELFPRYELAETTALRVTRNADIDVEISLIDDDIDYREQMSELIENRPLLGAVRLQLDRPISEIFTKYLIAKIDCDPRFVTLNQYKLDLAMGFDIYDRLKRMFPQLAYPPVEQIKQIDFKQMRMMDVLKQRDYLIAYPYHSSSSFTNFLNEAATDPQVKAIKITLYRVANPSQIVAALLHAANRGKEVVVVLELRARFDEENNINYSKTLQDAGCQVIFGIPNYKIHAKVCVIAMKQNRYFTYIGTGNFNEKTQRQYTDLGLLTSEQAVGEDAMALFDSISRDELPKSSQSLWIAPHLFRSKLVEAIDEEITFGEDGEVTMKLNSLNDPLIMDKLIEASQAGVDVNLIVRGICCLIPGVPGYTDNVTVKSIVGRYLEHTRIYKFGNGSRSRMYIGSGDLLNRNTQHRIEVFAKIKQHDLKSIISKILDVELSKKNDGWILGADSHYYLHTVNPGSHSQDVMYRYFMKRANR